MFSASPKATGTLFLKGSSEPHPDRFVARCGGHDGNAELRVPRRGCDSLFRRRVPINLGPERDCAASFYDVVNADDGDRAEGTGLDVELCDTDEAPLDDDTPCGNVGDRKKSTDFSS